MPRHISVCSAAIQMWALGSGLVIAPTLRDDAEPNQDGGSGNLDAGLRRLDEDQAAGAGAAGKRGNIDHANGQQGWRVQIGGQSVKAVYLGSKSSGQAKVMRAQGALNKRQSV